jgi:hypothetical protein
MLDERRKKPTGNALPESEVLVGSGPDADLVD